MAEDTGVVAFTGQLLVVGGRAVRMSPPGALAERAPRRASRAREDDTFFMLLTPAAGMRASSSVFESLAQLGVDVYFGTSGGITGGLREALGAIHTEALNASDAGPQPWRVGALALVLRGNELYVARSGRMFGVLQQWPDLALLPPDRHDPLEMALRPLGVGETPDIQLTHYTVAPGQALLLADASLIERSDEELRSTLSAKNVADMLERVKGLAGDATTASIIRFLGPGTSDPTGKAPQPSPRTPRSAPERILPSAPEPLPPPADPPVTATPQTDSAVRPMTPRQRSTPRLRPRSKPAAFSRQDATPQDTPMPPPAAEPAAAVRRDVSDTANAAAEGAASDDPVTSGISAGRVLKGLRLRLSTPLSAVDDDATTAPRGPSALERARTQVQRTSRNTARTGLSAVLSVVGGASDVLEKVIPEAREDGKPVISTNIAIGMAVLIPFVIVVVVVGLALSERGKGEFQYYMERAEEEYALAVEMYEVSDEKCADPIQRLQWVKVLDLAQRAERYRPNDLDVQVIIADARNYLDCFDAVQRRDLKVLHEFAGDADLVGPIVNGGVDLYTLDRANGRIYHDTLNETGDSLTTRDNSPILWTGQVISSAGDTYVVGEFVDIEWLSSGGTAHDNVLIALDRDGQLLAYSATFFESAQQLAIDNWWVEPRALAVFRSNIYILDAGADQIWRYVPPAGVRAYASAPEEYFNGDERPDLADAVDFGISDEGAVFILYADGEVRLYSRNNPRGVAEEEPFTFRDAPEGLPMSGAAMFMDNDPLSRHVYIVDPAADAIFEFRWGGTFEWGYRPRNMPDAFDNLTGFYADSVVRNNMYVLAGNKLYQFRRAP
ncbi:MAG: hypothetical protein K8S97_01830 [Anaerolineae bacterium]|nr:hypothetical protein [Anaerolineae bacterium]